MAKNGRCVKGQGSDCFGARKGFCLILKETKSIDYKCPFYKTVEQAEEDRQRTIDRLRQKGREDLIQKYGLTEE